MRALKQASDDISHGLKKWKLHKQLQCDLSEIKEETYSIPIESIPRIIGRQGANLRALEAEKGVSIDIDNKQRCVRIMGSTSSISASLEVISTIIQTKSIDVSLSDEALILLALNHAKIAKDIEESYSVRIEFGVAKRFCCVTGLEVCVHKYSF